MDTPIIPLSYAPSPPRWRRRVRRGVPVLLLIALIGALFFWRRPIWHHIRLQHYQYQCLHYRAPSDLVVYDESPERAIGLLAPNSRYVSHQPRSWFRQQAGPIPTIAAHIPPCWQRLQSLDPTTLGSPTTDAILFMHERRSQSGQRRLIVISIDRKEVDVFSRFRKLALRPANVSGGPSIMISPALQERFAARSRAVEMGILGAGYHYSLLHDLLPSVASSENSSAYVNLRFFAGQPDAHDASHFSIPFEFNGTMNVIEGWLENDDCITLQIGDQYEDDTGWPRIGRPRPRK